MAFTSTSSPNFCSATVLYPISEINNAIDSSWKVGTWQYLPSYQKNLEIPMILNDNDAIIRIIKTTICGTDLHLLKGSVSTVKKNVLLGHEGIGEILEIGSNVLKFKKGDRILISCITRCNQCIYCYQRMYGQCLDGGWQLGHTINGMQGEICRIPNVEYSAFLIPNRFHNTACEDELVLCSDILPTGLEVGLLEVGFLSKKELSSPPWLEHEIPPSPTPLPPQPCPSSSVTSMFINDENTCIRRMKTNHGYLKKSFTLIGCGPVGLSTLQAIITFFPYVFSDIFLIDINEHRIHTGHEMIIKHFIKKKSIIEKKSNIEETNQEEEEPFMPNIYEINNKNNDASKQINHHLSSWTSFDKKKEENKLVIQGTDLVVEAIGLPVGWCLAQEIVKPGGHISILGVHGKSALFHLDQLWCRNFSMSAGMVHGSTIPTLMLSIMKKWDDILYPSQYDDDDKIDIGRNAEDGEYEEEDDNEDDEEEEEDNDGEANVAKEFIIMDEGRIVKKRTTKDKEGYEMNKNHIENNHNPWNFDIFGKIKDYSNNSKIKQSNKIIHHQQQIQIDSYSDLISHRMHLKDIEKAYLMFKNPSEYECLKILLVNDD